MSGPKWMLWLILPLLILLSPLAAAQPDPDDGTATVYDQKILVEHADGQMEWVTIILVPAIDGRVYAVDKQGRSYESLDDFLTNNSMFTPDDEIVLPRDFPAIHQPGDDIETIKVQGKKSDYSWIWWGGGGVAIAIGVALLLWWKGRAEGVPILDPEPPR